MNRNIESKIIPGLQRLSEVEIRIRRSRQLREGVPMTQPKEEGWIPPSPDTLRTLKAQIRYLGQPR